MMQSTTVTMRRLDDLWQEGKVSEPGLIKIDVEGHERDVFAGARKLIAQARPRIEMEYNSAAASAARWTLAELAEMLKSCAGYQSFRFTRTAWNSSTRLAIA